MADVALVDPELRQLLSLLPPLALNEGSLSRVRGLAAQGRGDSTADNVREVHVAGFRGAPAVRLLVVTPGVVTPNMPAMLDIHGGGYVMGSPDQDLRLYRERADALGCVIVGVDYRLAPETRFPGALQDCYSALRWMHAEADGLGVDRKRIGVSGSSAGGGLAVALALFGRQRQESLIAFQHLVGPMLDDRTCLARDSSHVGQHIWTRSDNRFGWESLLGQEPGGDGVSSLAAAAREDDLAGLPPTYLAVGALDLFLHENLDFVVRLADAGVSVEAHVYPGAFHGFLMVSNAAVVRRANKDSLAALRKFCAAATD